MDGKYNVGENWLDDSIMEKDLGVLEDHKLDACLQHDAATKMANVFWPALIEALSSTNFVACWLF